MPYPYTLLPDGHTLEPEDVVKPPAETQEESTLTQSPHLDFGNPPTPPAPEPNPFPTIPPGLHVPPPPTVQRPQPEPTSETTRPSQTVQLGEQILRRNEERARQDAAAQNREPSLSGFPQDIGWSPYQDATGLVTPGSVKPDIGQDALLEACGYICEQNPEVMTAVMNIIEGFDPDDDEQTLRDRVENYLGIIGLNDAFGHGDWYTTRLGPAVKHTATRIVDYYFDMVAASRAESAARSATPEVLTPDATQALTEAGEFEQPEISILLNWGLTEAFSGEWDPRWTTKEELQEFLVSDLKRIIHGFNETARIIPGFDETVINWADLTVEESLYFYRVEIALELAARVQHYGDLPPEYYEIKASLDRATELESLAGPIPLDDTEAYAAAFAGNVHVPDAETERKHVQDQLALIYEHLQITTPDNYLEIRSTTELKYELYYRLNYDVHNFIGLGANEGRLADFLDEYRWVARDTPQGVIDRLQGTFRKPDVVGFLFIMGLSIVFEPVDYVLTAVDVIQALSEGDIESAVGNVILGATPFVSSKLDDLVQPVLSRVDNIPLLPARIDSTLLSRDELRRLRFSDETIDIFEYRGGTGPGSGLAQHNDLLEWGPEHTSAVTKHGDTVGTRSQDENARILREQYGYNVINEPSDEMLERAGIDSAGRTPDYFIEGRPFDAYTVSPPIDPNVPEATLINTVWNAIYDKVPSQTDRLVIDLSHTPLTSERFIADLSRHYVNGVPLDDPVLMALRELKFMRNGRITDIWVKPIR